MIERLASTFIRIAGAVNDSIVDGPGIRYAIFTQGCYLNCKGCQNPQTHSLNGGVEVSLQTLYDEIKSNPLVKGVTFSGGEPFIHAQKLVVLASVLKSENYNLWAYSGYTFEQLLTDPNYFSLLKLLDVLVDGPYVESLQSYELDYRGSSNQRIIDVQKSLSVKGIVLLERYK